MFKQLIQKRRTNVENATIAQARLIRDLISIYEKSQVQDQNTRSTSCRSVRSNSCEGSADSYDMSSSCMHGGPRGGC